LPAIVLHRVIASTQSTKADHCSAMSIKTVPCALQGTVWIAELCNLSGKNDPALSEFDHRDTLKCRFDWSEFANRVSS
jgi:hypothetical protein